VGSPLLKDRTVVIVEDEGLTQLQLKKICTLAGMRVVGMASDGQSGVDKVLGIKPDVVLMDVNMPGMDGIEAAARILADQSTCVIMLTAYNIEDYKKRCSLIGAAGYVLKPVTYESLIPEMETAYSRHLHEPQ
jgi:response regulator NasT